MFLVDKHKNEMIKLKKKTFSELGFKEREHLQEWIANQPIALGEELLIIQKEFDGFSDTKERLDLLALDKEGNLVIIENKLDDSGRDVTWQALKYTSYCSSLSKEDIRQIYQEYLNKQEEDKAAEDMFTEFFNGIEYDELILNKGFSQRIILIAANFRKEVTSTVMWLLNYNIKLQCFRVSPYVLGEKLLLNFEQIIPIKDTEEYTIKMAEKNQLTVKEEEKLKTRHHIRLEFWKNLLENFKERSHLFNNISPSKDSWIGIGNGISSGSYNFVVSKNYARVEVYFSRGQKDENKFIFDLLEKNKLEIENKFGDELIWERLNDKKACRIKYQLNEVSIYDEDDWGNMMKFLIDAMIRLHSTFDEYIKSARQELAKYLKRDTDDEV